MSPLDFNERRTPRFSRTTWIALAIVGAAHAGLGVALYYQRFELQLPAPAPATPIDIEFITLPKPKPPVAKPEPAQAPNTKYNDLPARPTTPDVIHVVSGETVTQGTTITIAETAPEPVENAPATEPVRPTTPPVISNPAWVRQPNAEQLMRAYPDRALQRNVGGSAMLNCLVQANGRVTDCRVSGETPGGYGFGRAAQGLTRHFQISPRTVNGAAEGSRVNIGIRFTPPPAD